MKCIINTELYFGFKSKYLYPTIENDTTIVLHHVILVTFPFVIAADLDFILSVHFL